MTSPIQASASVTPLAPRLPAAKAEWIVDAKAKTSTAALFGGTAVISRHPETQKFHGVFELADKEDADKGVKLTTSLKSAESLLEAQQKFEATVRSSLSKTHPELLGEIEEAEAQERVAAAGKDPF
ncbi:hypothetical protein BAJUN_00170 [Bajunvirus bajun]|uniref:Uncharacterized protein n=1 Tax=Brevundimonas phage vB_BgoS-Bajun TaxID=2948594 RepID=A0A9E7SUP8_9CAUD|nr:hypothetical protein BAJUN_00170 [Brevundimonas phage vB_BgoS-Bajun]